MKSLAENRVEEFGVLQGAPWRRSGAKTCGEAGGVGSGRTELGTFIQFSREFLARVQSETVPLQVGSLEDVTSPPRSGTRARFWMMTRCA